MLEFSGIVLLAYVLGSIPTAYLVAKWFWGINLMHYGSGSIGASNVMHTISIWPAIPVLVFDIGKGVASVWIAQLFGLGVAEQIVVGLAAIAGHNWSVFIGFSGGRGIATSLGIILVLSPKLGLIILAFSYFLALFRQHALGVFIAVISLPLMSWFFSPQLDIENRIIVTVGFTIILIVALFRRLTAAGIPTSTSTSLAEILLNRLVFDRDVKDREEWILRTPQLKEADNK